MFDFPAYKKEWNKRNPERTRGYCRAYYARNIEKQRKRIRDRYKSRQHLRDAVAELKSSIGCKDCGEKDADMLEYDHRDPSTKAKGGVAYLLSFAAWERIIAEIAKCDVRCASCHRKKTLIERRK